MPLYADANALIALGELNAIDVLSRHSRRVVITPTVRAEVRVSSSQIDSAINQGWMHVEEPHPQNVAELRGSSRLHQGEAEIIEVASRAGGSDALLLIDEGKAFLHHINSNTLRVVCLAQALHELEDLGHITSASRFMQELVSSGAYRWAKVVRQHSEKWCAETGHVPV